MWKTDGGKKMKTAEPQAFLVMGGVAGGTCLHGGTATRLYVNISKQMRGKDRMPDMAATLVSRLSKQAEEAGTTRRDLEPGTIASAGRLESSYYAVYANFYSLPFMEDIDLCPGHDSSIHPSFIRLARSQLESRVS
jgi:hypothetical protein